MGGPGVRPWAATVVVAPGAVTIGTIDVIGGVGGPGLLQAGWIGPPSPVTTRGRWLPSARIHSADTAVLLHRCRPRHRRRSEPRCGASRRGRSVRAPAGRQMAVPGGKFTVVSEVRKSAGYLAPGLRRDPGNRVLMSTFTRYAIFGSNVVPSMSTKLADGERPSASRTVSSCWRTGSIAGNSTCDTFRTRSVPT
jgi:hypothetical protein